MTALFAIAMMIIGSQVQIDGRGTGLLLALATGWAPSSA